MEKKIQPVLWAETVLLAVLALAALFPFVYMILTSMRQTYSMELNLGLSGLNLRNYSTIFKNFEFGKYLFLFSIIKALSAMPQLVFDIATG